MNLDTKNASQDTYTGTRLFKKMLIFWQVFFA